MDRGLMLNTGHVIDLGGVALHPQRRTIEGPAEAIQVEPLVMRALCVLAVRTGRVVQRQELFDACWDGRPVGDDSLNRLIAAARRGLKTAGCAQLAIATVPGAGYVLSLLPFSEGPEELEREATRALQAAFISWRSAVPIPDFLAIERLKRVSEADPNNPAVLGMLSLIYRHATEYGSLVERAELVRLCEAAARRALAIDPDQPEARIALVGVVPILGNWREAHRSLNEILATNPDHVIAAHDLSIVEMATGRVREAKALIDPLWAADPLAPCFGYKSAYHHWSLGDIQTMDERADRAIQLWPDHPAVWTARFWTLAHTGRPSAALSMIDHGVSRPPVSQATTRFLRRLLAWAMGEGGDRNALGREAMEAIVAGPAQAIGSLMALGLLGDVDGGFQVAEAYYLQSGDAAVPPHGEREVPMNEMRRRLTQILFTPACEGMRMDPRFPGLCDRIGLRRYWDETGRRPQVSTA